MCSHNFSLLVTWLLPNCSVQRAIEFNCRIRSFFHPKTILNALNLNTGNKLHTYDLNNADKTFQCSIDKFIPRSGFPRALEIMENLENYKKSSMHGNIMKFKKNLNNHGKIMEFCEII